MDYLDDQGKTIWTTTFERVEDKALQLPVLLIPVSGVSADKIVPFTVKLIKDEKQHGLKEEVLCGPEEFIPNCWGHEEDVLVCSDGSISYTNHTNFTWMVTFLRASK